MPHPDADDLALLALGESLGSAVDAHVAGCAACTAEIDVFRETVGLADLSNYGEDAPRPGEHVWAAIAAELGFNDTERVPGAAPGITLVTDDRRDASAGTPPDVTGQVVDRPIGDDRIVGDLAGTDQPVDGFTGDDHVVLDPADDDRTGGDPSSPNGTAGHLRVVPDPVSPTPPPPAPSSPATSGSSGPQQRRRSRWAAPLAAAVIGIAVGAGAVVVSQNRSDEVTVEAIAPLTPVAGGPLTNDQQEQLGKAELVVAPTGQEVRVNAADLPPSANSYEVWLFGDDGRMVSLGTLSDGSGSFVVPEGINTREYRVVDVSDEPPDGNPLHSGISLIRGAFT